jgi:hypothetical protein
MNGYPPLTMGMGQPMMSMPPPIQQYSTYSMYHPYPPQYIQQPQNISYSSYNPPNVNYGSIAPPPIQIPHIIPGLQEDVFKPTYPIQPNNTSIIPYQNETSLITIPPPNETSLTTFSSPFQPSLINTQQTNTTNNTETSNEKFTYIYIDANEDNENILSVTINELITKINLHNDSQDNIYVIISNKKNKTEILQTYSVYIQQSYNKNNREKNQDRFDIAIKNFKNACVIFYEKNCIIISYASDYLPNDDKLIDFDDDLEIIFNIGFKRIKNNLQLKTTPLKDTKAITSTKEIKNLTTSTSPATPIVSTPFGSQSSSSFGTPFGSQSSSPFGMQYNFSDPNWQKKLTNGGKTYKNNESIYDNIPFKKNGKLDFVSIQNIGRKNNNKFIIHKSEKDYLKYFNITHISNYKYNASNKYNIIDDTISKIKNLLLGINFKQVNKIGGFEVATIPPDIQKNTAENVPTSVNF